MPSPFNIYRLFLIFGKNYQASGKRHFAVAIGNAFNVMDIEKLIPHRDRMKLIDAVVEAGEEEVTTSALVKEQWPLVEDGFVDPIILIELVAQTAAVHITWKKSSEKSVSGSGWIVGVRDADLSLQRIGVNTLIHTRVRKLYGAEGYNVMEGIVTAGENIVARIQIQVYHAES